MRWDSLWTGVHLATLVEPGVTNGVGEIHDAALAVWDGRIAWLGRRADLPPGLQADQTPDGAGAWITERSAG